MSGLQAMEKISKTEDELSCLIRLIDKSKSAPGALPLPKHFTFQSVSVLAARFFAQRPVAASTSENRGNTARGTPAKGILPRGKNTPEQWL
ncbi:MAG: hypothetical protein Q4F18_11685 [Clostridia bacterium]|nr:hypothetical protein [Clostridia bacterium]